MPSRRWVAGAWLSGESMARRLLMVPRLPPPAWARMAVALTSSCCLPCQHQALSAPTTPPCPRHQRLPSSRLYLQTSPPTPPCPALGSLLHQARPLWRPQHRSHWKTMRGMPCVSFDGSPHLTLSGFNVSICRWTRLALLASQPSHLIMDQLRMHLAAWQALLTSICKWACSMHLRMSVLCRPPGMESEHVPGEEQALGMEISPFAGACTVARWHYELALIAAAFNWLPLNC